MLSQEARLVPGEVGMRTNNRWKLVVSESVHTARPTIIPTENNEGKLEICHTKKWPKTGFPSKSSVSNFNHSY